MPDTKRKLVRLAVGNIPTWRLKEVIECLKDNDRSWCLLMTRGYDSSPFGLKELEQELSKRIGKVYNG